MVPYHTYAPRAEYAPPPAYPPYLYRTHRYYPAAHVGYGLGYSAHSFYRPRAYGPRPGYAPRMVYGPSPHAYGPRPSMMHRPYWHG
jgi:hypothetical protein